MFINKNVKHRKNSNPILTELPCDGSDNYEGDDDEVDGSIKDVGFDNVNAGDGENKAILSDVYNGGGDSNDDVRVGNVGGVNTNGGYDVDFGNGDSKLDCGDDRGSGDGGDKDDCGVNDDGDVDSNICNDTYCDDGRSKVDYSKDIVVDDNSSKSDGGGNTNDDGKGGDDSDLKSNECADGPKNDSYDDDGCFKNKQIVLENF